MIHHCKNIFISISYIVWKKNCVNLISFSLLLRFNIFYFYDYSWFRKKEDFIQFFILLWSLLIFFEKHLKVSSFWNLSVLFICYSFMILSQNFKNYMLLTSQGKNLELLKINKSLIFGRGMGYNFLKNRHPIFWKLWSSLPEMSNNYRTTVATLTRLLFIYSFEFLLFWG